MTKVPLDIILYAEPKLGGLTVRRK